MTTKRCNTCKLVKDLEDFHINKRSKDGRINECKLCRKERRKNKFKKIRDEGYPIVDNETRTCSVCGILKLLTDFHKSPEGPQGRYLSCKKCRNETNRGDYENSPKRKRQAKTNRKKSIAKNMKFLESYKTNKPCIDCGKCYPSKCMEFDHLHDKKMNLSKMAWQGASIESLMKEIKKCELVCVLCHRDRTYKRIYKNEKQLSNNSRNISLRKNRRVKLEKIRKFKDVPCAMCGKKYNHWQMDFDHINPNEKSFTISSKIWKNMAELLDEISKCWILCALCHAIKTHYPDLGVKKSLQAREGSSNGAPSSSTNKDPPI